jgi:hypothetical protein
MKRFQLVKACGHFSGRQSMVTSTPIGVIMCEHNQPSEDTNVEIPNEEYAQDFEDVREAVSREIAENERRAKENQPTKEQLEAIRF